MHRSGYVIFSREKFRVGAYLCLGLWVFPYTLKKGNKVWLSRSDNPKRKLKYTLQIIEDYKSKVGIASNSVGFGNFYFRQNYGIKFDVLKNNITPGDVIRVSTRRGNIEIPVREDRAIPEGVIFIPFCYNEAAANLFTNPALDPFGKIPEFKYCAAKIEIL